MLYRFILDDARFYPDERDGDGRSLMAVKGTVHDWGRTPEDGCWVLEDDDPPAPDFPAGADRVPEDDGDTPLLPPVLKPAPADPEPAPAPVAPADGSIPFIHPEPDKS